MTTTSLATYAQPMQRDVAAFHDAFEHPNLIATPGPLPLDRIDLRVGMIREEGIVELEQAINELDVIGTIDALIDTVYVSLGALVEMGKEADAELLRKCTASIASPAKPLLALAAQYLAANKDRILSLETALHAQTDGVAAYVLTVIAGKALQVLNQAGIDAQPFFDEVHRSNLSKLGADGKPIYSRGVELDGYPAGKVLKGPNYVAADLRAVYERLYAEDSIPVSNQTRAPRLYALVSDQGTAMSETVLAEAEFTPENQRRTKNNAPADWDGGDFHDVSENDALNQAFHE